MLQRNIKSFTELIVWQKSHELFLRCAEDIRNLPRDRVANVIADQLMRAIGSISANIAEGFGRRKGREYLHYLIIARGSSTESINWYLKCRQVVAQMNFISYFSISL